MIEINLLPKKKKLINRFIQMVIVASIAGLIVFGTLAAVFVFQSLKVRGLNKQIIALDEELAKLQETLDLMDKYEAQRTVLNTQMGIIDKLNNNRTYWARLLDDMGDRVPSTMWLKSMVEQVDNVTGDHKLVVTGMTYTNFSVANFMSSVETSPFYSGVDLIHVTRGSLYGKTVVSFELHAVMKL